MLEKISATDQVSIVALAREIKLRHDKEHITALASALKVPLMNEWRNRKAVIDRLSAPPVARSSVNDETAEKSLQVAQQLISQLMERSSALHKNSERSSYALWFKQMIVKLLDEGASYKIIHQLTGISEENLPSFRKSVELMPPRTPLSSEHTKIESIWREAKPKQRRTLDHFWTHLGRHYPDLSLSRGRVREILIDLGLHKPRMKSSKNSGTQVKTEFAPHAIWEGDGKQIVVKVNGERFTFCWYAFVDQTTTLIVGSNIGMFESSEAFLQALRDSHQRQGLLAYGLLIDNRLGERDMGPIDLFCKQHGIQLIRTFPGGSKTNGQIENNFSVFERFVGEISITGQNPKELAASIAKALIEVFTQQRNHAPRRRFGDYSPLDKVRADRPPEYIRTAIEKLAARFNREADDIQLKWSFLKEARAYFGELSEKSLAKIMRLLAKYPLFDIIAAQNKHLAQIKKHPTQTYRSEYFMAILRNTREEEAKEAYNEAFRAGLESMHNLMPPNNRPVEELADDILELLIEVASEPTPARRLVELDALGWWMVQYSADRSLPQLWTSVSKAAKESILISLKSWSQISEYLMRRVGKLLVVESERCHRNNS